MSESSTAADAAASATSRISARDSGEIRISLSEYAEGVDQAAWRMAREKIAARLVDRVFGAGGTIDLGDCGRPWCTERAGEHAKEHVGDDTVLTDDQEIGSWWGYLLQEPGTDDFETVRVAFSSTRDLDFELPVWQLVALRDLFADESARRQLGDLLRLAAGR